MNNLLKPEQEIKAGIYIIYNNINKKVYIGSSSRLRRRMLEHERCLQNNKHHNRKLQNFYNKYGSESLTFRCIEIVEDIEILIFKEQIWIDFFNAPAGFNIRTIAESNRGVKHTEKTKEKLSKPVLKKNMDGQTVKVYPSIKSSTLDGFSSDCVSRACRYKKLDNIIKNYYKGFYWDFLTSECPENALLQPTQRIP